MVAGGAGAGASVGGRGGGRAGDECGRGGPGVRGFAADGVGVGDGFRRQGQPALAAGRRGRRAGEQQALPPWMQGQLVQTIRGHNPDQLRLPFFLWTRGPCAS